MPLYDFGLSTLEQYGLNAKEASRTRGALLCVTEKGLLILREFRGSEKKLQKQQKVLKSLEENGFRVDSYLENREGNLISRDCDDVPYTLQKWYEGRECDTKSREDIYTSVRTLAKLHKALRLPVEEDYVEKSLRDEYLRHNQELRRIQKYIRKKGPCTEFEKKLLSGMEWFLSRGEEALAMLEVSDYDALREKALTHGQICHGEYTQHNVLMVKGGTAVTNFGHWGYDIQMADLYCFMRKILEKYNWDTALAGELLRTYHQIKEISPQEWWLLRVQFTYPEKYWKLANYYFSHNKAWISEKNNKKLSSLIRGREAWENFVSQCFGEYPF